LEKYPRDTAGGIMTTQVTALFEYLTVENAITLLRRLSQELEQMFYVYVVDRRMHLVGVLSMRDLILARPARRLREIMIPNGRAGRRWTWRAAAWRRGACVGTRCGTCCTGSGRSAC